MRSWSFSWGSTKFYPSKVRLHLYEYPWWVDIPQTIVEQLDAYVFRHKWCCPPEWTFHIPLLPFRRDSYDGYWEHSLGSIIYTSFQKSVFIWSNKQKEIHTIEISDELAEKLGLQDPLGDWTEEEKDGEK